jgi:hypothetical protein
MLSVSPQSIPPKIIMIGTSSGERHRRAKSWQLDDADNIDHAFDDRRQPFHLLVRTWASIGMRIVPTTQIVIGNLPALVSM